MNTNEHIRGVRACEFLPALYSRGGVGFQQTTEIYRQSKPLRARGIGLSAYRQFQAKGVDNLHHGGKAGVAVRR